METDVNRNKIKQTGDQLGRPSEPLGIEETIYVDTAVCPRTMYLSAPPVGSNAGGYQITVREM